MQDDAPRFDYAALFEAPAQVFEDPSAIEIVRIPALCVTSGALIGLDPSNISFLDEDYAPYERTIAPGLYPGFACVDRATQHVAATLLRLRRAPVARWALATPSDEALEEIALHEPGTPYGYECRGIGGLADAAALESWARAPERMHHALEATLHRAESPRLVEITLDERSGANLWAAFVHDGGPSRAYWGFDAEGEVVALVSDFFTGFHAARPRGSSAPVQTRPS